MGCRRALHADLSSSEAQPCPELHYNWAEAETLSAFIAAQAMLAIQAGFAHSPAVFSSGPTPGYRVASLKLSSLSAAACTRQQGSLPCCQVLYRFWSVCP